MTAGWLEEIPWAAERFSTPTVFDAARKAGIEVQAVCGLQCLSGQEAFRSQSPRMYAGRASTITAKRRPRKKRSVEEIRKAIGRLSEAMRPSSIVVWSVQGEGPIRSSFGGLLGRIMVHRGVHAVLLQGLFRDVEQLRAMGLNVWSQGTTPASGAGCFEISFEEPVEVGGAKVQPQDLVFLDASGSVVLPGDADLQALYEQALAVEAKEARFVNALEETGSLERALDALTHI